MRIRSVLIVRCVMSDREFIAVFHYDNGGTNRCGAEPYRYAEEIVRCKDCKHLSIEPAMHCTEHFRMVDADFFCADGERREP